MQKLSELEPAEVSLVPKGANKKKFLIFKSLDGEKRMTATELETAITKDPKTFAKVQQILKEAGYATMSPEKVESTVYKKKEPMDGPKPEAAPAAPGAGGEAHQGPSAHAMTAMKAAVRILHPHREELTDDMVDKMFGEAGLKKAKPMHDEESAEEEGSVEEKEGAAPPADGGFYAGRQGVGSDDESQHPKPVSEEHHEQAHAEAEKSYKQAYGAKLQKLGYRMYPDAKMEMKEGEAMAKESVKKEDLLASVPKETRAAIEAVFKQNEELETILKEERDLRITREFVAKAESFKNFGTNTAELADVLKKVSALDKETYAKIEKMLVTADAQIGTGKLFSEIGSSLSAGSMDAHHKIDAAVKQIVEKSSDLSYEAAYEKFLMTAEGQKLYADHQRSRKDGI